MSAGVVIAQPGEKGKGEQYQTQYGVENQAYNMQMQPMQGTGPPPHMAMGQMGPPGQVANYTSSKYLRILSQILMI